MREWSSKRSLTPPRRAIAREVQDGLLTQAQADQMLSRLTADQIDLSRTGGHPGTNGQSN